MSFQKQLMDTQMKMFALLCEKLSKLLQSMSIRSNQIFLFFQFILHHAPDVVLVSETGLKSCHNFRIDGYKFFKNGGGTAIIIICDKLVSPKSNLKTAAFETTVVECEWNKHILFFVALYVAPNSEALSDDFSVFFF